MTIKSIIIAGKELPVRKFDINLMYANPQICTIAKRSPVKAFIIKKDKTFA